MLFFSLFGRGPRPSPNSKKKHVPAQTAKKITRPRPFRACFFWGVGEGRVGAFFCCCLGGGRVLFFAVWAGVVFLFLLFGQGACSCFCCLGRGRVLFLLFGRGSCFFFLLFGPGACFFLLLGRGTGVH